MVVVSGNWAGEIGAYMALITTSSKNVYKFPWSILLAGLGGIFSLIIGIVDAILFCCLLTPAKEVAQSTEEYMMYEHTNQDPPEYTAAIASGSPSNSAIMYNNFNGCEASARPDVELLPLDNGKPEVVIDCEENTW